MTNKEHLNNESISTNRSTRKTLALAKRVQILNGAKLVFMNHGFDGASMDQIASVSGVSKATVYKHFSTKEELFIALVEGKCAEMRSAIFNFDNLVGEPRKILFSLGVNFIKNVLRDEEMHFYRIVMAQSYKLPSIGHAFKAAGPDLGSQALSKYLQKLCDQKILDIQDPDIAAHQFIALCDAGIVQSTHLLQSAPSDQTIRNHARSATDLFMRGYSPNSR
jgi:TetR/AcrR family transcriptional regulator, mexJK operon transcriptional repressor